MLTDRDTQRLTNGQIATQDSDIETTSTSVTEAATDAKRGTWTDALAEDRHTDIHVERLAQTCDQRRRRLLLTGCLTLGVITPRVLSSRRRMLKPFAKQWHTSVRPPGFEPRSYLSFTRAAPLESNYEVNGASAGSKRDVVPRRDYYHSNGPPLTSLHIKALATAVADGKMVISVFLTSPSTNLISDGKSALINKIDSREATLLKSSKSSTLVKRIHTPVDKIYSEQLNLRS